MFSSKFFSQFSLLSFLQVVILLPFLHVSPPQWNSPYRGEGAYPPRSSNQSASTKRAQLIVAAKAARPTDLLKNVKT